MTHVINAINSGYIPTFTGVRITIQNYTTVTGEAVTLAEFGIPSSSGGNFLVVFEPCTTNSLGRVLFPVVIAGAIRLFQVTGGVVNEIPTTAALNAAIRALIVWQLTP